MIKRVGGVTGYIVYKMLTPRITQVIDKILALTTKLGIGRSRSIGFGEIEVKPKPPKEA
jgi:CRISPR/Cas system endoribonuclease Cas6 (RAMP superfamily)